MKSSPLYSLVEDRDLVICSGAGGVGKTTTSAAIGLAAAQRGRKAVVLTIDPARRLANALGLEHLPNEPVDVSATLLDEGEGSLHALMLDPKQTFDALVRRLHGAAEAERLFENRLYQNVTGMIAGMQEYAAGEKLHELANDPRFDLVVVDTPPTRNALDFLEAPKLLSRFLDERVLRWFLPQRNPPKNPLLRRTAKMVGGALGKVFGEGFATELAEFLARLGPLTAALRHHAGEVRARLASPSARFVLVTSPLGEAVGEALYFHQRLRELDLPFGGYVINRMHPERPAIDPTTLGALRAALAGELGEDAAESLVERLSGWYATERARAQADRRALEKLRGLGEVPTIGIPLLEEGSGDERILLQMVETAFVLT